MTENNLPYFLRGINALGKFIPYGKDFFDPDKLIEKGPKKNRTFGFCFNDISRWVAEVVSII